MGTDLTQAITEAEDRLRPATRGEIADRLRVLDAVFPRQSKGEDERLRAEAFVNALHGVSLIGLTEAVSDCLRGEVEGMNKQFGPSLPELLEVCRQKDGRMRREADELYRQRNEMQAHPMIAEFSDEHIAAMKPRAEAVIAGATEAVKVKHEEVDG